MDSKTCAGVRELLEAMEAERKEQRISVRTLADRIGFSYYTVWAVLCRKKGCTVHTFVGIALGLGMKIAIRGDSSITVIKPDQ